MNLNKKVQTSGPASWLPQPSYAVLTPSYWLSCSPFTSCLPASGVLTEPPSHAACVNSKTHPCWAGRSQYISSSWIDAYPLNTCKKIGKCSFIKKKNPKSTNQPTNQPKQPTKNSNPKQNQKESCSCHHIFAGTISASTHHLLLLPQPCQAPADAVLATCELLDAYATYIDPWPLTTACPVLLSHPAATSCLQRPLLVFTL